MRYIGGKSLLLDNIYGVIHDNCENADSILDIFAGSGAVSQFLYREGFDVISNDFLYFSYVLNRGTIGLSSPPEFSKLHKDNIFDYLNNISIEQTAFKLADCFIYNNYSPNDQCNRMYFQNGNALRIDLIRLQIEEWFKAHKINEDEYFYLLAALINAVPYVSNITGTYGAYLKFWDKRTYKKLELCPHTDSNSYTKAVQCENRDFTEALKINADVLYADPPYNSREYLPNYHILETIARYDYPVIKGVTGLRNYDNQKSPFCRKDKVHGAFEALIRDAQAKYIIISYNNEGLISTEDLTELCQSYALDNSFRLYEYDYRRYKSKIPNNKAGLKEQIYFLRKK